MLMIYCPHCQEEREEEEFHYAGQANIKRPTMMEEVDDKTFGNYLYFRKNIRGMHTEMWSHAMACRKYFNVVRDTESYRIYATYRLDESIEFPLIKALGQNLDVEQQVEVKA